MILYRCGHFSDSNLSKGNYWSNFITECKPYYRGKISIIDIELDEKSRGRYMLSREIKTMGHSKSWAYWKRVISDFDEKYDQKYIYISPTYMKKAKLIKEYTGEEALKYLEDKLKEEKIIIDKYC